MKTNLRERPTMYQCVIRPKVHFVPELSFKVLKNLTDPKLFETVYITSKFPRKFPVSGFFLHF